MGPKKIHGIQVQLEEYNQVAGLHQQVFSYRDEVSNIAKNIFIPYQNPLPSSPFEGYTNGVFSTGKRMWGGGCEGELNRIHGRILPAIQNKEITLAGNVQVWIRNAKNIQWQDKIPGIIHLTHNQKRGIFQYNKIQSPNFQLRGSQLLKPKSLDTYGNILAEIDGIQGLVTGDIRSIMREDNSQ